MLLSLGFIRFIFLFLSTFFITTFAAAYPKGSLYIKIALGLCLGVGFSFVLIGLDKFLRKWKLRSLFTVMLGLFVGFILSRALLLIFHTMMDVTSISIYVAPQILELLKMTLVLFSLYVGTIMVYSSSKELAISIPYIHFHNKGGKNKTILPDFTVLCDPRMIDLASTGLIDHQLAIPKFMIEDLYHQLETHEEPQKTKAKKSLETIKKLEAIPSLSLEYIDIDYPEIKDFTSKLLRLARKTESHILTADNSKAQHSSFDAIRIINLNTLSAALKPTMQTGEVIKIKIQRFGKEPKQGVGYLEDGTMVVVNGAGNCIGEIIDAQVLSVKHTNSGRLIFCNAYEEDLLCQEYENELLHEQ